MNTKTRFFAIALLALSLVGVTAAEYRPYEMPRTQVVPIKDKNQDHEQDRQYELYIKLPENYAENTDATFPVIYITDAVWHIELMSAGSAFLMEDVILVGISWQKDIDEALLSEVGEYVSRFRDYTVRESTNAERQAKYQFGQASRHLRFIRDDVIPYVESQYRTDPDNRSYFGYSASGLFGAYVLMAQPDTFRNYILGSPSVQNDIPHLIKAGSDNALAGKGMNANVFISYGELEEEASESINEFVTVLKNRKDDSLSLQLVVIESADHGTAFPPTGIRGLKWLAEVQKERDES